MLSLNVVWGLIVKATSFYILPGMLSKQLNYLTKWHVEWQPKWNKIMLTKSWVWRARRNALLWVAIAYTLVGDRLDGWGVLRRVSQIMARAWTRVATDSCKCKESYWKFCQCRAMQVLTRLNDPPVCLHLPKSLLSPRRGVVGWEEKQETWICEVLNAPDGFAF